MSLDAKKLKIFEALLSSGGLKKLIAAAVDAFGNPIAIVDRGMSIIAMSDDLADEPQWAHSEDNKAMRDIRLAARAGDFQRVYEGDSAILGDYQGSDQRYLAARIRRGNNVMGHVLVLERKRMLSEEDQRLLPDFCRALGYVLSPEAEASQLVERHGSLFSDILSGTLSDAAAIEARARRAQLDLPKSMIVLVVQQTSHVVQVPLTFLRDQILRQFPDGLVHMWAGNVLALISSNVTDIEERVGYGILAGSLAVGLSYPFCSLAQLGVAFGQANAAIRLSSDEGQVVRVVRYEQVVAHHLIECASARHDGTEFEHPAISRLAWVDERDKSDFLNDLKAYLSFSRSATAAARERHVHKNTMYYRIARIEEITRCDLSDEQTCFALQIGLVAHQLRNRD